MSIAWRAILVAGLAAGEEATLASLTGLFQREPERAAALVSAARTRAINQSRHSEGHETYFRQRRRIEAAVGDYKFYVHRRPQAQARRSRPGRVTSGEPLASRRHPREIGKNARTRARRPPSLMQKYHSFLVSNTKYSSISRRAAARAKATVVRNEQYDRVMIDAGGHVF